MKKRTVLQAIGAVMSLALASPLSAAGGEFILPDLAAVRERPIDAETLRASFENTKQSLQQRAGQENPLAVNVTAPASPSPSAPAPATAPEPNLLSDTPANIAAALGFDPATVYQQLAAAPEHLAKADAVLDEVRAHTERSDAPPSEKELKNASQRAARTGLHVQAAKTAGRLEVAP